MIVGMRSVKQAAKVAEMTGGVPPCCTNTHIQATVKG
jgi:hypothetical protein